MSHTVLINDGDSNSLARQAARTVSLLNSSVSTIAVDKFSEIQAAGNLIDCLDAFEDREGIILVNAAPRHGSGKNWENGTPFGYFKYKNILVCSTIAGQTLSLVKKLKLVEEICVTDIPTVLEYVKGQGIITDDLLIDRITRSQYRSFDYLPRLAKWVVDGRDLQVEELEISEIDDSINTIWWIDNYGNCKTNLLPENVDFEVGKTVKTKYGDFKCYSRMKDVPNGESAIIIGSSGIGNHRFLEIIVQGESAAEKFNVTIGEEILT